MVLDPAVTAMQKHQMHKTIWSSSPQCLHQVPDTANSGLDETNVLVTRLNAKRISANVKFTGGPGKRSCIMLMTTKGDIAKRMINFAVASKVYKT